MRVIAGRRKTTRGLVIVGVATLSLVSAGMAAAVVSTTNDALVFATAVTDGIAPTGAAFSVNENPPAPAVDAYECVLDDPATVADEGLCPTGVGNTPLAGFPTAGATYGVLTSGNAA